MYSKQYTIFYSSLNVGKNRNVSISMRTPADTLALGFFAVGQVAEGTVRRKKWKKNLSEPTLT